MKRVRIGLAAAIICGTVATDCFAQAYVRKLTVNDGGGACANTSTILACSIGQTVIGTASNGTTIGQFGFWNVRPQVSAVSQEHTFGISLDVFPNPATHTVRATIQVPTSGSLDVAIVDVHGVLVRSLVSGSRPAGSLTIAFDVSALATGTYFVAARMPGAFEQRALSIVH